MDGARFANGLVPLGATPAEMTWKAGVDMLSFGGTKNGFRWCAEAICSVRQGEGRGDGLHPPSAPRSSFRRRVSFRRSPPPISRMACGAG